MHADDQRQVIEFLLVCTGVRVPLGKLPEALGPTWYELDALERCPLSSEDEYVLLSCLSQTLLGEPWSDDAYHPENTTFLSLLLDAAAARGWETEADDVIMTDAPLWGTDFWQAVANAPILRDSATMERILGKGDQATDRTDEVLNWYADVSGIYLSETDLEQLPEMVASLRSIYRLYGLEHDTPNGAVMRAQSLALWLLGEPWPETTGWEPNAAFVAKLQTAAQTKGLRVEPKRWRWEWVKAFQEACHV